MKCSENDKHRPVVCDSPMEKLHLTQRNMVKLHVALCKIKQLYKKIKKVIDGNPNTVKNRDCSVRGTFVVGCVPLVIGDQT